jgi:hypothetical protein
MQVPTRKTFEKVSFNPGSFLLHDNNEKVRERNKNKYLTTTENEFFIEVKYNFWFLY